MLVFYGCDKETDFSKPANTLNLQYLELNSNLVSQTENVDSYNHPIFNEIRDYNHVTLAANTKYIFSVPILMDDMTGLTLNGNGSTICFPFNGVGIQINHSSNIKIHNLIVDNTDDNNQSYYSNPEEGRLNILNSDHVVVDNVEIEEQGSTPENFLNHIQVNVYNSTDCEVSNSIVKNSHGELIVIDGSNDCKVINNKTYHGQSAIATKGRILSWYRGYRTTIKNNYVYGTSTASITVNDRQTVVENNQIYADSITYKGGPGIRFGHYKDTGDFFKHLRAKNCIARLNTVSDFLNAITGPEGSAATGIRVDATVGIDGYGMVTIENNLIQNCKQGVTVSNAPGQSGKIRDNQIQVTAAGISIYSSDENNLADFEIIDNEIISNGLDFIDENDFVVRLMRSQGNIDGNIITLNSSSRYAKAIEIRGNSSSARVDIIGNVLNVNDNYGIHHTDKELDQSNIVNNAISNARVGMLLKSKNTSVSSNNISNATEYGILFWKGSENCTVMNNFISVSFSAAIRLHNTKDINVINNGFNLLAGSSLYSVYKSAYNHNPIIENNLHNWPNQSN